MMPPRAAPGRVAAAAAALLVAACAAGPGYQRPEVTLPAEWRIDAGEAGEFANVPWWTQFGDPVLDELVAAAVAGNLDVGIAAARMAQFAGALESTRSGFLPQVSYGLAGARARSSEFLVPPGVDLYASQYQAAIGASWQLDLFGRLRRESEAAQARVYASEQGRRGVVLSVVSSVAAAYISLRALDRQLEIARATAANHGETLRIFELRHERGVVSRLEVAQIESQYEQALAVVPSIEAQIAAQENLLSILLGRHPGPIVRGRALADMQLPGIPAGLPAGLLAQRPDILEAEQALVAANADVGAARALYYPDLTLTGTLGQLSTVAGDLLDRAARTWALQAAVAGPIFTGGAISGRIASTEAAREGAVLGYQRAILNALREVDDALAGLRASTANHAALQRRAAALREYAGLARMRFDAGAASYLDVLFADSELFAAELAVVTASQARYASLVDIYKALGGGWIELADALADTR
jgi:outer membrane protein, multidrug efflux system